MNMPITPLTLISDLGADTVLHVANLNTGNVAICSRSVFTRESLADVDSLVANQGGLLETPLGMMQMKIGYAFEGTALLQLKRNKQQVGTASLAWLPHTPGLWAIAVKAGQDLERAQGGKPVELADLTPPQLPWMTTLLLPEFLSRASEADTLLMPAIFWLVGLGILEQQRRRIQLN